MIRKKIKEHGMALAVTMLIIFLVTTGIGISALMTSTTGRQSSWSRDNSVMRAAAEGAVEYGYGVWAKYLNTQYAAPSTSQMTAALGSGPAFTLGPDPNPPALSYASSLTVQLVDVLGAPTSVTSGSKVMLKNFPGWSGTSNTYVASAKVSEPQYIKNGVTMYSLSYGAKRTFNYSNVPLFQATAFFQDDLELFQTAPMQINGLVHTNSYAYVSQPSNGTLSFGDSTDPTYLSFVGGYSDSSAPPYASSWSGFSSSSPVLSPNYNAGGQGQQVNQVTAMYPMGADTSQLLSTTDANDNNDSMRELIEPPDSAYTDPTPIAQRRLYDKAGILIHMAVSHTTSHGTTTTTVTPTITTQNGTTLTSGQRTTISNALSSQTIYDRREGQNIDLTSLDLSQVRTTLAAVSGFNNIIYIDRTYTDGSIPSTDPQGIRLLNGNSLPAGGLTVATQNPLYIQGDYNTANNSGSGSTATTPSAAVYADAVTILSNSWSDNNSSSALPSRRASTTTVNTALVAGFVPSGWVNPNTGVTYGYSGGLNNFPRFLEDWTSRTFNYNGSMIELFHSKIAVGQWDTGNIYVPPTRVWNFDDNFLSNPPPGSLTAVTIARGSLMRY